LKNQKSIDEQIQALENELSALDAKREALQARIIKLKSSNQTIADEQFPFTRLSVPKVTNQSPQEQKIALFRSLFRGREDFYPRRFESKRSGKSGYQIRFYKEHGQGRSAGKEGRQKVLSLQKRWQEIAQGQ